MEKKTTIGTLNGFLAELEDGKLAGFAVVRYTNDGTYSALRSVTLLHPNGNEIEICGGDCSGRIVIAVPAKPKLEKRFKVFGKIQGVDIKEQLFESRPKADGFILKINNDSSGDIQLDVEEIEVEV